MHNNEQNLVFTNIHIIIQVVIFFMYVFNMILEIVFPFRNIFTQLTGKSMFSVAVYFLMAVEGVQFTESFQTHGTFIGFPFQI